VLLECPAVVRLMAEARRRERRALATAADTALASVTEALLGADQLAAQVAQGVSVVLAASEALAERAAAVAPAESGALAAREEKLVQAALPARVLVLLQAVSADLDSVRLPSARAALAAAASDQEADPASPAVQVEAAPR
jgi:hypothetical protein